MSDLASTLARIEGASRSRFGPQTTLVDSAAGNEYVPDVPLDLAIAAGVSLDVYSLARNLASEMYHGNAQTLLAIGECARNEAHRRGISVSSLLGRHVSDPEANGHYGRQVGRFASTAQDPNGRHVVAAAAVLDWKTDIARGATKYFDPKTQNAGFQGSTKLRYDAAGIIEKWAREGFQWIGPIAGVDSYRMMAFKSGAEDRTDEALALVRGEKGSATAGALMLALAGSIYLIWG